MSEKFIHKVFIEGEWKKRDEHFALSALIAETLAVYYWCEAFAEGSRPYRFCVFGQRGLAEHVARATKIVVGHINKTTEALQETQGFKFGSVIALREALRARRSEEQRRPEYMDQCNVSTYRAKSLLDKYYKVGVKDVKAEFDIEGFKRGAQQKWTLKNFKTPIQVLDAYAREQRNGRRERDSVESGETVVRDPGTQEPGGRDQPPA